MQRILTMVLGLAVAVIGVQQAHAKAPRNNPSLPKVDYQIGQITPLGQGLSIPVTNRGFVTSPKTAVSVAIYDRQSRRLLTTKFIDVPAIQSNQTRRVIVVPPSPGQPIVVRAMVDPGNRVPETNERNNQTASQH